MQSLFRDRFVGVVPPFPVPTPEITVSILWHPRLHADSVHRWLRAVVRDVCAKELGAS